MKVFVNILNQDVFANAIIKNLIIRGDNVLIKTRPFWNALIKNILIEADELTLSTISFYSLQDTDIMIVANVPSITSMTFSNSKYASITIIGNVGAISSNAFENSTIESKSLIIDENIGIIERNAFINFSDYKVTITGHVSDIQEFAFGDSSSIVQNLTLEMGSFETNYAGSFAGTYGVTIYLSNQNPMHFVHNNAFQCVTNLTIYVPENLEDEFVEWYGE